jgi:hypothetical protein
MRTVSGTPLSSEDSLLRRHCSSSRTHMGHMEEARTVVSGRQVRALWASLQVNTVIMHESPHDRRHILLHCFAPCCTMGPFLLPFLSNTSAAFPGIVPIATGSTHLPHLHALHDSPTSLTSSHFSSRVKLGASSGGCRPAPSSAATMPITANTSITP